MVGIGARVDGRPGICAGRVDVERPVDLFFEGIRSLGCSPVSWSGESIRRGRKARLTSAENEDELGVEETETAAMTVPPRGPAGTSASLCQVWVAGPWAWACKVASRPDPGHLTWMYKCARMVDDHAPQLVGWKSPTHT